MIDFWNYQNYRTGHVYEMVPFFIQILEEIISKFPVVKLSWQKYDNFSKLKSNWDIDLKFFATLFLFSVYIISKSNITS